MAFDAARGVSVMFGGSISFRLDDTYEYGGGEWALRANTGPSPRQRHAMAFDSARGTTVLFGGLDDSGSLGDRWAWVGDDWSLVATEGPASSRATTPWPPNRSAAPPSKES